MRSKPPRLLLEIVLNPQGLTAIRADNARRAQRIERAPGRFTIEKIKPPKKTLAEPNKPVTVEPVGIFLRFHNNGVPEGSNHGFVQLMSNNTWSLVAQPDDMTSLAGVDYVRRLGDYYWTDVLLGGSQHALRRSTDLETWTDVVAATASRLNAPTTIDRAADGRLWMARCATSAFNPSRPYSFYVDDDGTGDNFTLKETIDDAIYIVNGVACHPTDPNIVAFQAHNASDYTIYFFITQDGGDTFTRVGPLNSGTEAQGLTPGGIHENAIIFNDDGRLINFWLEIDNTSGITSVTAFYSDDYASFTRVEVANDSLTFTQLEWLVMAWNRSPLFVGYSRHYDVLRNTPAVSVSVDGGETWIEHNLESFFNDPFTEAECGSLYYDAPRDRLWLAVAELQEGGWPCIFSMDNPTSPSAVFVDRTANLHSLTGQDTPMWSNQYNVLFNDAGIIS